MKVTIELKDDVVRVLEQIGNQPIEKFVLRAVNDLIEDEIGNPEKVAAEQGHWRYPDYEWEGPTHWLIGKEVLVPLMDDEDEELRDCGDAYNSPPDRLLQLHAAQEIAFKISLNKEIAKVLS